jgi:hypothetical protein
MPCAAQVSLVRDGQVRAVVVRADEPSPVTIYAVEELLRHVEKATGVRLKVMPESEAPVEIYFDYWESYSLDNRMRLIKLYWDVG